MAHRKFTDREGRKWMVRPRTRSEWDLEPFGENTEPARCVASPGYEKDPYELSEEELQGLLDASALPPRRQKQSPFRD